MNYKEIYEIILKTICENDRRILDLLAHITRCDDILYETSMQEIPNHHIIQSMTTQKERLLQQLEDATSDEEKYMVQLNNISSLCTEVTVHPLYLKMELLHDTISKRMELVLRKEDNNNPAIVSRLENYQDKLELDLRISEVPMEKRRIFYLYPNQ